MKRQIATTGWAAVLILASVFPARAQFAMPWTSIDGGGKTFSTGGVYSLGGTIGQPDAGMMSGGAFELAGGFWVAAVPTPLGDCDGDGDVELSDFQELSGCLGGPGSAPFAGCTCFDFDADNDVDLFDFAGFQVFFTGP